MEAKITQPSRPATSVKALVVTEYYPRTGDPVGGVWAHRQTLAAVAAGAEVRVLVLHRPVPPLASLRSLDIGRANAVVRQQRKSELDGIKVEYVRYASPPRPLSYRSWGAWAAPLLGRAIARVRRSFAFDLIHAHYAVPAGDAVRRVAPEIPLVVSVHGHDVQGAGAGSTNVRSTLAHAQPGARQQRRHRQAIGRARRAAHARRAPRRRRSAGPRHAPGDADAGDGRPPGGAQATRGRDRCLGRAARAPPGVCAT